MLLKRHCWDVQQRRFNVLCQLTGVCNTYSCRCANKVLYVLMSSK